MPSPAGSLSQHPAALLAASQSNSSSVFRQLLHEVLVHSDSNSLQHEADLSINVQLVKVVVSAGLLVLFPASNRGISPSLVSQAADCLLVIRLTLKRTPEILAFADSSEQTLLFWLLPRLLSLLGVPHLAELQQDLEDTLSVLFSILHSSSLYWPVLPSLYASMIDLTRDVLDALAPPETVKAVNSRSWDRRVSFGISPPTTSHTALVVVQDLFEFHFMHPQQAFVMPLKVVSLLMRQLLKDTTKNLIPGLAFEMTTCCSKFVSLSDQWFSLGINMQQPLLPILFDISLTVLRSHLGISILKLQIQFLRLALNAIEKHSNEKSHFFLNDSILTFYDGLCEFLNCGTRNGNISEFAHLITAHLLSVSRDFTNTLLDVRKSQKRIFNIIESKIPPGQTRVLLSHLSESNTQDAMEVDINAKLSYRQAIYFSSDDIMRITCSQTGGDFRPKDTTANQIQLLASWLPSSEDDHSIIIIQAIGRMFCARAHPLELSGSPSNITHYRCPFCDNSPNNEGYHMTILADLEGIFVKIDEGFARSMQSNSDSIRQSLLQTLLRISRHTYYITSAERTGWLLQLLHSKHRLVRLISGRILSLQFRSFPNEENNSVLQENRRIIFNHLRTLSNEDEPRLTETNILCWAQLGRFAVYEELNIILAKLINDLGHSNSFIRAVAFQELNLIAHYREHTCWRLLTPFWPSLSVSIVRQMKNRPQIIQAVSELLGITLTDFLSRTQSHTLPYLVYHKRQDIIEEIAQASKKDVPKVCFDNMPKIMAFLLVEVNERHETADVMSYLSLASPDFERIELPSLIRSEAIQTAVEILKMSDDQKNPTRRDRVFKALQFVSVIVCKPSSTSKDVTSSQVLHDFFRQHILGIMANISDTINDIRGHKTAIEKLQCVAAIGEIITTVGPLSAIAMPQILACLQSALAIPSLTKGTLKVWLILAKNLQPTEVKDLASTMFSILLQFWPQLKSNSDKSLVSSIFKYSFDNHFQALASTVESLPSLRTVPDLAGFDMHFQTSLSEANPRAQLQALISRCGHENISVCTQSLIELQAMLDVHENWLQCLILADKCDGLVIQLVRQLLDTCAKYRGLSVEITILCGECLGIVGAIDPSRLEISQSIADLVVLTNFQDAEESIGYTISLLDIHLVSAFRASLDTKAQGFLAYTMQELLKFCGFPAKENSKNGKSIVNPKMMRHWTLLSKASKETLSPLLSSKYFLTSSHSYIRQTYPIFPQQRNFREWLQNLTLDLCQIVNGENATKIFSACSRVIKDQDLSIANFVLPFVALNVIVGGSEQDRKDIVTEILEVLRFAVDSKSDAFESEKSKMACQVVFGLIDYANKWLRARRKSNFEKRIQHAKKANRYVAADEDVEKDEAINLVESVLSTIPADLMGRASSECGAHARSLYNWESYIRDKRDSSGLEELMPLYKHLQDVYARIDEPDGVEGISMRYPGLDADTQALEHEIAGRWSSALSCYELSLRENPCDPSLYLGLLRCLKQSGHYGTLILQLDRLIDQFPNYSNEFRRIGVEVGWMNENWEAVRHFLQGLHGTPTFETEIGRTLLALYEGDNKSFEACLNSISYSIVNVLAASGASVYRENYSMLIKLGIIREMSVIRSALAQDNSNSKALVTNLERRLLMTAPSSVLRQFILAVRKSTFSLAGPSFQREIASVWLDSAKVARKAGQSQLAYSSILQSTRLQYPPAILEEARWWWHEGHPRRAIQNLQTAFASKAFSSEKAAPSGSAEKKQQSLDPSGKPKNHIIGKATLLLARWLEVSGQSSSLDIEMKYKEAAKLTDKWEKAHFALGRHYCRLYDNEANQQPIKQNDAFLQGELVRLICLNYGRALTFGCKHIYQTMPRLLTLWLDFGASVNKIPSMPSISKEYQQQLIPVRLSKLKDINDTVKKYLRRLPSYLFLTAFPQMISRICHNNSAVYQILENFIVVTVSSYPRQSLWAVMAASKSTAKTRSERGNTILSKLKVESNKDSKELRNLVNQAQKMTDQLLLLCNHEIPGRRTTLSLTKDLHFSPACYPCELVIPLQSFLTVTLPVNLSNKEHDPFPGSQVYILSFLDEVDVMNSLQKPRKITILGSDGSEYPFLCKPKDDLRKDARLMEFNGVIIKLLKKDVETAKRRLGIRTYAVIPLNEECGLIEWVNHTRPLRDIFLKSYKHKDIPVNYVEIRTILEAALTHPKPAHIFLSKLVTRFPPVLHEWFVEEFSEPTLWLESRNTYARSMAVMSIVGYVLGLGDRHGENILLDETTGGVVHVDFNCLFEKGLTLQTPERVPFRLTHNMVDALGITGVEGAFRNACEATMKLLRSNQDALLSVLETFIHDPLLEWSKRRKKAVVPLDETQNQEGRQALDKISEKLKGFMGQERLPLSIQGHVDELIRQATDPENLVRMYIGWCAYM